MTQTNPKAEGSAVATALGDTTVRGQQNLLAESAEPGIAGARAALETFYYAFNTRSLDLLKRIWADDPLAQVDTPVAGLVRGSASMATLYERGFAGPARIQSALEDIVAYVTPELVVFTGRERGSYTRASAPAEAPQPPEVRTTCVCVFRFIARQGGWRQVYHHVAIGEAEQLAQFQKAVRGA
jgi:hypothetical protein